MPIELSAAQARAAADQAIDALAVLQNTVEEGGLAERIANAQTSDELTIVMANAEQAAAQEQILAIAKTQIEAEKEDK